MDLRNREWMKQSWETWTLEQLNEYNEIIEGRRTYGETFNIGTLTVEGIYSENSPYFSVIWPGKQEI